MVWLGGHTRASGICSIAAFSLLALLPSAWALSVDDVFEVVSGEENGSCDHIAELDDIFQETLDMSYEASETVNSIVGRASSRTTRRSFFMMFGIDTSAFHNRQGKLTRGEKEAIVAIQDLYGEIADDSKIAEKKPRLYCDSSYLIYTKNAYNKETGEKTDLPITDHLPKATDGAYWDPNRKAYVEDPESAKAEQTPCDNAEGFTAQNSITLCPELFKSFRKTLLDVKADQSTISEGDHLYATYKAASGALLHELTHLMKPGVVIDQPAYTRDGELEDPPSKSYNFNPCSNLAFVPNEGPIMAMTNADTYHIFAMMAYLNDWDWATGASSAFLE